eukprot:CAMPEP_0176465230 /NCGR_PEP_ID=MMETSP0127-20121128/37092_1 /TAXON_ID=938130 /ORGANISM="Platyophrya macrostoma, Strain WH" /LENGTH=84 /DNA_ID=CAMNT_0017858005 /DNA_START=218 /DNA_END=468 /DNA_ORIENTATION=+
MEKYSDERKAICEQNLATAMRYYKNSLNIAAELGLNVNHLNMFKGVLEQLPFAGTKLMTSFFEKGIEIGATHLSFTNPQKYRGS